MLQGLHIRGVEFTFDGQGNRPLKFLSWWAQPAGQLVRGGPRPLAAPLPPLAGEGAVGRAVEQAEARAAAAGAGSVAIAVESLSAWYGTTQALRSVSLPVRGRTVTAIIGPSGCGKSTLIRCLNRLHEVIPGARVEGRVWLNGVNIYDPRVDPVEVRRRVGMVFQKPNPFPNLSIFDNVAAGLRLMGVRDRTRLAEAVERSLRMAALWDEVKNRLHDSATALSGGQQQRLCVARALAVEPEVLLMDEPTSALDPVSTGKLEDLIAELKRRLTIVIVTHSMQQAARISDFTAFMLLGELVEYGPTEAVFTSPTDERTEAYVTGRFG